MGGDFNYILQPADSTGPFTINKALAEIEHGIRLTDMSNQDPLHTAYAHYSITGATRIDHIYLSMADKDRKTGIKIIPTAFTDHHAVVLRLTMPATEKRRRRGRWKMDPDIVHESTFKAKFQTEWEKWRSHKRCYPDVGIWWERHVKKNIKQLARQMEAERNKNHKIMENHLYECLYDILKANIPEADKLPALQKHKAKIVQLHARRRAKILHDTHTRDRMDDEDPTLYHVLRLHKRRDTREIQQMQDTDGTTHAKFRDIAATFVKHLAQKIGPLEVDPQALTTVLRHTQPIDPQTFAAHMERPIRSEEVFRDLSAGASRKTPGIGGICLEFYVTYWKSIQAELTQLLNDMFLNKNITAQQKQGILICLPKSQRNQNLGVYYKFPDGNKRQSTQMSGLIRVNLIEIINSRFRKRWP
jgi:hypothetical protein